MPRLLTPPDRPAFKASNHRTHLGLATLLVCPLTVADVGLPAYQEPAPDSEQQAPATPDEPMVIQQISYGSSATSAARPLHCDPGTADSGSILDFAAPPDKRVDGWPGSPFRRDQNRDQDKQSAAAKSNRTRTDYPANHNEVNIPLYINGNRAALKTGEVVNAIDAIRQGGGMLLVSEDSNYFSRLRGILPMDKLLLETPQKIRHYQVTRAGIAEAGTEAEERAPGESLTLAACYPFQPIDGRTLIYVIRAQQIPAGLPSSVLTSPTLTSPMLASPMANQEGGSYETVNF